MINMPVQPMTTCFSRYWEIDGMRCCFASHLTAEGVRFWYPTAQSLVPISAAVYWVDADEAPDTLAA